MGSDAEEARRDREPEYSKLYVDVCTELSKVMSEQRAREIAREFVEALKKGHPRPMAFLQYLEKDPFKGNTSS